MVRYALGTSHGPKENRQTSWWRVASFLPEGGAREVLMGLGKGWVWFFFSFFFLGAFLECVRKWLVGVGREGELGLWDGGCGRVGSGIEGG